MAARFVIAFLFFALVFVPLERVAAIRPQRVFRTGWRTDVAHFFLSGVLTALGLVVIVFAAEAVTDAVVPDAFQRAVRSLPMVVQALLGITISEITAYWAHRAQHGVGVLWRFHSVHHSVEEMDWLATSRAHPIDQLFLRTCQLVPLLALGLGATTSSLYVVFVSILGVYIHSNVKLPLGPLRWVIASPEFHHWHHARDPRVFNTNYSTQFPLIDLLFGTLHLPKQERPEEFGTETPVVPIGYVCHLAGPVLGFDRVAAFRPLASLRGATQDSAAQLRR